MIYRRRRLLSVTTRSTGVGAVLSVGALLLACGGADADENQAAARPSNEVDAWVAQHPDLTKAAALADEAARHATSGGMSSQQAGQICATLDVKARQLDPGVIGALGEMPWALVANRFTSAWVELNPAIANCVAKGVGELPWLASPQRAFLDAQRMLDAER